MKMILPEYNARDLLAANVQILMKANPDKGSPAKLAKHCYWPSGNKKGEHISERQIRYVLNTKSDGVKPAPSPTLDVIVAIGNAFHTPAWMLLTDVKQLRLWAMGKLFTSEEAVNDSVIGKPAPPPPRHSVHEPPPPIVKTAAMKRAKKL